MTRLIRRVWGLDGEGRDIGGRHRYVYLCALDRNRGATYELRNHTDGLSTEACLAFLVELPHGERDILAGFFFGYDTAMCLADLSDTQKTTLHRAGFVVWSSPAGLLYYIEYHPTKSLFIGRLERPLARGERPNLTTWRWHGGPHWVHIEDVGSYSGTSFVSTLTQWNLASPELLAYVQTMKDKRGAFHQEDPEEVERYCRMECALLAEYVATLQDAVISEGIVPRAWHGPGAIGSALLRREKIDATLADPFDPGCLGAVMASYFGGRSENCLVGLVPTVYNCDLRSAYPAALAGQLPGIPPLPDLVAGKWHAHHGYMAAPYALWHVTWSIPASRANIMPFPYRDSQRIWYPSKGSGWYHASLVRAAMERYSSYLEVDRGWVYEPDVPDQQPFAFVGHLARKRVGYKSARDPRERVLKLALNSLYGKLAQHQIISGQKPPFQCYFAAGYVTAATQSELFRQVYRGGLDGSSVVGFATDGLFTTVARTAREGGGLGEWEQGEPMSDVYVLQPGVYYASGGRVRTRGYGKASLGYADVQKVWSRDGLTGVARYTERRFLGLGYCSGVGDYTDYGQWVTADREVVFYPDKPVIGDGGGRAYYELAPLAMSGESRPYTPTDPLKTNLGYEEVDALLAEWWRGDQA